MAETKAVVTIDKIATSIAAGCTDWITKAVSNHEIKVPEGYNVGSEIALAMMKIAQTNDRNGKPALTVCSKDSVYTALRQMAMSGLSMAQNQCYPIVYDNQLQIQRSYFGTLALIHRMLPEYNVSASVVYDGDSYDYGFDDITNCYRMKVTEAKLGNRRNSIIAVFGTISRKDTKEVVFSEVMTWEEVLVSWSHAKTDKVQKEFPDQMAKRTLLNRMCKLFVNTYPIDPNIAKAYNDLVGNEYEDAEEKAPVQSTTKDKYRHTSSGGNSKLAEMLGDEEAVVAEIDVENTENTEEEEVVDEIVY